MLFSLSVLPITETCLFLESVNLNVDSLFSFYFIERCPVGKYYDDEAGLCRSCGHGFYQPSEGSFKCLLCGLGKTTRSTEAVTSDVSGLFMLYRSHLQCLFVARASLEKNRLDSVESIWLLALASHH